MRFPVLTVLGVASLALFFGLFFGLNYPEIVRQGWPLTRCRVLDGRVDQRYCCESSCSSTSCASAPFGAPSCGAITSQIDSQFSPSTCAGNSSACPANASGACDGGYKCCNQCCQTCKSCSTSCSTSSDGQRSCHESCSSYQCNCYCCNSTSRRACSYSCPTCYSAVLDISYKTYGGKTVNTTFTHDYGKDGATATDFLDDHPQDSVSACYYNPSNLSEVAYDVTFTTWKWVVSALFGILPLFAFLAYLLIAYALLPAWWAVKTRMRQRSGSPADVQEPEHKRVHEPPPAYQAEERDADTAA